jgi:hypothetical protein
VIVSPGTMAVAPVPAVLVGPVAMIILPELIV